MKKIAITGVTGFVGKRLLQYNKNRFHLIPLDLRANKVADIDLTGIEAIVHLAGKAHQMQAIDDSIYFEVNYNLTRQLAERAQQQGVPHFIYISSTKVYGDDIKVVLNEKSPCVPTDAYGESKLKAELYLQSVNSASFATAIVRPPLVYGPEVKGNMIKLLQLAAKNYPLPFGSIGNARSMVFVYNLIELINTITEQRAAGVFVAGDAAPVSTDKLITLMRKSLGNSKGLLSIPGFIRSLIKKAKPALYVRLFGSFVVDNAATNKQLSFAPPFSTEYGVEQMVKWYMKSVRS